MEEELLDSIHKMQALERARKIPSINYLWSKSTKVYGRVKETNTLVHWALDTMENVISTVIERSLSAKLIEKPIYVIDKTLCQGLDYVEVKVPMIKEESKQILNRTKLVVSEHLMPAVKRFNDLKQETKHKVRVMTLLTYYRIYYLRVYSWQQADKVMSTEIGINILKTVDSTTDLAKVLLDKYLPPSDEEFYDEETEKMCSEHARLHHTVERLNQFSSLLSQRIYFALIDRWQHMYKIEIFILVIYTLTVLQIVKLMELIVSFTFKVFTEFLFNDYLFRYLLNFIHKS